MQMNIEDCLGDSGYTYKEYTTVAQHVKAQITISESGDQDTRDFLKTYCNADFFTGDNSKNVGTIVENGLKNCFLLSQASNESYDACDINTASHIEIKSATARIKGKGKLLSRGLYIANEADIVRGEKLPLQHFKSMYSNWIFGGVVYMDGIILYLETSSNINPYVGRENYIPGKISMSPQQRGHATEGTLTASKLHRVAIIKNCKIKHMKSFGLSFGDLITAYNVQKTLEIDLSDGDLPPAKMKKSDMIVW